MSVSEKALLDLHHDDPTLDEAIVRGAKMAHDRIQACLNGAEKTVSEEEILALLKKRK